MRSRAVRSGASGYGDGSIVVAYDFAWFVRTLASWPACELIVAVVRDAEAFQTLT